MPRFRARSFQAVLLATALTSTVAAPVAAAPEVPAASAAIGAVAKVATDQGFPFDLAWPPAHFYNPGTGRSRATGSIRRTEKTITIDGYLDDSGPGTSELVGTIFWRSGTRHNFLYTADNGRRDLSFTWTLDTKQIKEVQIVLCKHYGGGLNYRCAKAFTADFSASGPSS